MMEIPIWVFVVSMICTILFVAILFLLMWLYIRVRHNERKEFQDFFQEYYDKLGEHKENE